MACHSRNSDGTHPSTPEFKSHTPPPFHRRSKNFGTLPITTCLDWEKPGALPASALPFQGVSNRPELPTQRSSWPSKTPSGNPYVGNGGFVSDIVSQIDLWIDELDKMRDDVENRKPEGTGYNPPVNSGTVDSDYDTDASVDADVDVDAVPSDFDIVSPDCPEDGSKGHHITNLDFALASETKDSIEDDGSSQKHTAVVERRLRQIQGEVDVVKYSLRQACDLT
ncbi:hypothetical protein BDW59DRAFT_32171 [Aspergillus cavernicola]|uniref:Uncharacterized protein n=1 Tax=Aspergillus cavernicola TaxID=176166 RepID=A0ABR4IPF8_9EURO